MRKFNPTKNQKKWLDRLKNKKAKRLMGRLASAEDKWLCCCLGHACHALNINKHYVFVIDDDLIFGTERDFSEGYLPEYVKSKLNLRLINGAFRQKLYFFDRYVESLAELNDLTLHDVTPQIIAKFIEENYGDIFLKDADGFIDNTWRIE